ncbi:hypothetical protein RFI_17460 [Reticulomyxa filosa]|uniref:Uncharacterized protein n=1 Tax=Reticulomyxa filosa TaxID=46433 RepID=X6N0G3_RETFI|nr:hypothetical protein RFI_17460 [Reticulomyxa filosa]|eukprot:ETO19770.1 hypothetical protein RFI_17460 [Reticulomyxa filosa]
MSFVWKTIPIGTVKASRIDAYTEYGNSSVVLVLMSIWFTFFVIMKIRCIMHVYKFMRYSREEKKIFYLSQQRFVGSILMTDYNKMETGIALSTIPYTQLQDGTSRTTAQYPLEKRYSSSMDSTLQRETKDFIAPIREHGSSFEVPLKATVVYDASPFTAGSYVPTKNTKKQSLVLDENGNEFGERHYSFVAIGTDKEIKSSK